MAVDHHTYVIKNGGRPKGAGSYGDADAVRNLIAATQPGKITTAAGAFDDLGTALNDIQTALYDAAKVLADYWSGPAADKAQESLRRLYTTAEEVVIRSNETARTLQWYGGSILPMYRNIKWPKNTRSPAATAAADQVMKNLNERIAQTWDGMPAQIEKNLPRLQEPYEPIPTDHGDRSSGAGSRLAGSTGGNGYRSRRGRTAHPSPRRTDGHDHSEQPFLGGGSPSPSLNSSNPSSVGTAELAGLTPGGDGPAGGVNLGNGMQAPRPGDGAGAFGVQGTNPGAASAGFEGGSYRPGHIGMPSAARMRPDSSGVLRGSGTPFVPTSSRGDKKERERTTWLTEDEDVWVGGEVLVSGVIGESPSRVVERNRDGKDILNLEELQQLLDLVDEQTGVEVNEILGESSDFNFADDALSGGTEWDTTAAVSWQSEHAINGDEASLCDSDIDASDLLGIDDLGKRNF